MYKGDVKGEFVLNNCFKSENYEELGELLENSCKMGYEMFLKKYFLHFLLIWMWLVTNKEKHFNRHTNNLTMQPRQMKYNCFVMRQNG